jgi:hypothetical protein
VSDHSRFVRLITLALASCAVTWALAGAALAVPDNAPSSASDNAPAFKAVPGDTDKAPSAGPPAFKGVNVDANKTPNPAQVDKVLAGIDNNKSTQPASGGGNDDTGTIALIVAIAAILTALAAMTMTVVRNRRPMLGA